MGSEEPPPQPPPRVRASHQTPACRSALKVFLAQPLVSPAACGLGAGLGPAVLTFCAVLQRAPAFSPGSSQLCFELSPPCSYSPPALERKLSLSQTERWTALSVSLPDLVSSPMRHGWVHGTIKTNTAVPSYPGGYVPRPPADV